MASEPPLLKTTVLPVDATKLGSLKAKSVPNDYLDDLDIELDPHSVDAQYLRQARLPRESTKPNNGQPTIL
jgi:hypothetical protein